MSLRKQQDRRLITAVFVICLAASISFPTVFAFASGNQALKKGFVLERAARFRKPSFLFSTEPAKPPVAPIANVVNGASSKQVSFDGAPLDKKDVEIESISAGSEGILSASLLGKVRQMSNFASFLCVLDCTLLPLVTVALPLLGILNLGAGQLQAIDKLGHSLALFFVLPVGSLTTVINYISHKKKTIAGMAVLGLTMVGLANSHIHVHHWPTLGSISLDWMGRVLHKIQACGASASPWHRIVNVSGCALLLGSNYWSQRQDGCAAHDIAGTGDCQGHDHNHDHDH